MPVGRSGRLRQTSAPPQQTTHPPQSAAPQPSQPFSVSAERRRSQGTIRPDIRRAPVRGLGFTGRYPSPGTAGAACESRGDLVFGGPARLPWPQGPPRPSCGEVRHGRRISLGAAGTARAGALMTSPVRASLPCLPADWTGTNRRGYRRVRPNPVKPGFPRRGKSAPGAWQRLGTGCLHPVYNSR